MAIGVLRVRSKSKSLLKQAILIYLPQNLSSLLPLSPNPVADLWAKCLIVMNRKSFIMCMCPGRDERAWPGCRALCKAEVFGGVCPAQNIWGHGCQGGVHPEGGSMSEVTTPKKGINRPSDKEKVELLLWRQGRSELGRGGSEAIGWEVSEWVGLGKLLCRRGRERSDLHLAFYLLSLSCA